MATIWMSSVMIKDTTEKAVEKKAVAHALYVAPASPWKQFVTAGYNIPYWFNTSTGATTRKDPNNPNDSDDSDDSEIID